MMWNELWSVLSADTKSQFESHAEVISLKRGESIYHQGDAPRGVYFVESGLVGLMLLGSSSGKEYLLRFFRQGQFFGHRALFSDEGYHGNTLALEPTILKLVPKKIILQAIDKHPELLKDVVRVLSKELRRCETNQVMILENQIQVRVAQTLIYLKDLDSDHNWTRQEIANFCASTVSTVIKALAQLETDGFIKQTGRTIEILDREGLILMQDQGIL